MEIKVVDGWGRVVIPAELRRKYSLKSGEKVVFIDSAVGVELRVVDRNYFNSLAGALGLKGKHLRSLLAEKKHTDMVKQHTPDFANAKSFPSQEGNRRKMNTKEMEHTPAFGHPSREGN